MQRVCFIQWVRPERLEEYKRRHAAVWEPMLRALKETGWNNYSLFLSPDGMLVGYFESPDPDAAFADMDAREINAQWQAEMGEFFVDLAGKRPDEGFIRLPEVFHLEDQLAALTSTSPHSSVPDAVPQLPGALPT